MIQRGSYVSQTVVSAFSKRTQQKPQPSGVYKNAFNNHVQLLVVSLGKYHIALVQEPSITSNLMAHALHRFESSRRIRGINAGIHCGEYHY